eukprot:7373677-Ditylum_brightwellii.AAC.1
MNSIYNVSRFTMIDTEYPSIVSVRCGKMFMKRETLFTSVDERKKGQCKSLVVLQRKDDQLYLVPLM